MMWANNRIRFLVTSDCNINCYYCHNEGQPKSNSYLTRNMFDYVLNILASNESIVDSITFSGGEPLLHPSLEYFILSVVPFTQSITLITNGILLSKEKIRSLKKCGVKKIRIGIDSIINKNTRPSNITSHLKLKFIDLIEVIRSNSLNVELNVVISKYNFQEIRQIIRFCSKNSISAKFFELIKINNKTSNCSFNDFKTTNFLPFIDFNKICLAEISNLQSYPDKTILGDYIYRGVNFTIRYCRYTCISKSCYITGTRIDPEGEIFTCNGNRGLYRLDINDSSESANLKIRAASNLTCKHQIEREY